MKIDAFINDTVRAHNRTHPDIIISKSCISGRTSYFLYLEDYDIWGIEELFLYRYLYERLSQERIYPIIQLSMIEGVQKIGIAIEVNPLL